jgi:acetoin utilization protein AcuC
VTGTAAVVWDDALASYDFGPGHPLAPIRVQLAMHLITELGLLSGDDVTVIDPDVIDDDLLATVHDHDYIEAVKRSSADPSVHELHRGLGTDDVPTFLGMHEASRAVCGATLAAARSVFEGRATHAVNLAGGLHHAMPGSASGFCVYNDLAISIQWLLDHGVDRVAYIDVDVHHGDGVQAAFWNEPRVLTVSVHESGRALFPGTGFPMEVGGPDAVGSAVNLALPPGTGDEGWLRAFHGVVPEVVKAFRPDVIVTQQGCDTHADDPLAHLMLTVDGQRLTYVALHELAHSVTGGKWIATGGGGYSWIDVVPRAWSHLVGELVGAPIPPETPVPEAWRSFVTDRLKVPTPGLMTDGAQPRVKLWEQGYDPADPIDAAVLRTRDAVYPWHGLTADPYHGF